MQHLAAPLWQCLTQLTIGGNQVDMHPHPLAAANWPPLTRLTIQPYSSSDVSALSEDDSVWHTLRL